MVNETNFRKTGLISERDLKRLSLLPSKRRLAEGPCVIIECVERIPCDPCVSACPRKAIEIEGSLIEIPRVDFSRCLGCLLCIPKCPGLCIFVVHKNYTEDSSLVSLPYEFLINFSEGEEVLAQDLGGRVVCRGKIEKISQRPSFDQTAIIQVKVPKRFFMRVRGFRLLRKRR